MKKLKLQLNGMKNVLTKVQMQKVVGGYGGYGGSGDGDSPGSPTGSDDGISGGGSGYKCCWSNRPSVCSVCVSRATSRWTCVSGATLTAC